MLQENEEFAVGKIKADEVKIHIRIQQRNARKSITILEGLSPDVDVLKLLRALRKKFNCMGTHVLDQNKSCLQFSGDQRDNLLRFLVEEHLAERKNIVLHGY